MKAQTRTMVVTLRKPFTASALACAAALAVTTTASAGTISEKDVLAAQQAWGEALVQISKDFEAGGIDKARATAEKVLATAYAYDHGKVLFKPTLTQAPHTFRLTADGALAYFIGHDKDFPADVGFALKGWRSVDVDNAGMVINGSMALSMGNVTMTDKDGNVTTVDKTWGYMLDDDGALRIVLHHSSLPYQPADHATAEVAETADGLTMMDRSWGLIRSADGATRIKLHHTAQPPELTGFSAAAADELTMMDRSWGLIRSADGATRIKLHHTAQPQLTADLSAAVR